ncbi:MAG: hypothetical protein ABL957_10625 [Parvularculaceae bacterium]
MTTGRDALHRMDQTLADARKYLARASDAAAQDAKRAAALDSRELEAYQALAELRIEHLRDDEARLSLGAADRKARELIVSHSSALAALAEERDRAAAEITRLEDARRAAETAHDDAVSAHERAVAATRARLDQDAEYERRAGALENGQAVARRAAQKLETAHADRETKGRPYEADPLFAYLERRKFGTRDYRAFPLFALLDRWVASLIRYRDAKLNYNRLVELPERLAEHAARVEAEAARLSEALEAYEREALERDGVDKLRDAASEAHARLEALDGEIDAAEARHKEIVARFGETAAGKAGPLGEARTLLTDALGGRPIPDLKTLAAETVSPRDDEVVDELVVLRRERLELEHAREAEHKTHDASRRRLSELEDLRRRFKQSRFDSPYSEFPGADVMGALIAEFLRGAFGRDEFWREVERRHTTRKRDWDDDFGGDSWRDQIGRPRRGLNSVRSRRARPVAGSARPCDRPGGVSTAGPDCSRRRRRSSRRSLIRYWPPCRR